MPRLLGRALAGFLLIVSAAHAQTVLTWEQVRERFRAQNPNLAASRVGVDESKAQEITAYLRPNPDLTVSTDGTQLTPYRGVWRPFAGTQFSPSVSYLHEREHKRELRLDSARGATAIASSTLEDQDRTLLFNLRSAFVNILHAKEVLRVAQDNLTYYDRVLEVNRTRQQAGDISEVDLGRLELQRVQYESDLQNADVSLRTAKIQLLSLLNERTPIEKFDVNGNFDFTEQVTPLEEFRTMALDARPDLRAALQAIDKAKTDHQLAVANGSADPTFSGWWTHNPSFNNPFDDNTIGASVSIPLRIHDKNQGEKLRTQLDITRNESLADANRAQVFSDVDSAYATIASNVALLRPYKDKYLPQAAKVRDTISFAYQNGGASLLDFLSAQNDYRNIQLSYLNLVGSYMTAAGQMNLAVGKEVIP
ncbi:MAG TPA: TolC family protein [Bryobacteraceae bacterium]|jgi:cobalt-zinc-cadmium efflux system outer membrane protein|nr:TolC family protein [Bryobacteraceae bacterium]